MPARIRLEALRLEAVIGLLPRERFRRQLLLADIAVDAPADGLLDYRDLQRAAEQTLQRGRFALLEDACAAVSEALSQLGATNVRVALSKPAAIPAALRTSIEVRRP